MIGSAIEQLESSPIVFIGAPSQRADIWEEVAPAPEIKKDEVLLDGAKLDIAVQDSIVGGEGIKRTMEGASTVKLDVVDPTREIVRSDILKKGVDLEIAGLHFTLVRVGKSGNVYTFTFEDREVNWMRQYDKPLKAFRDKVTRAQFIYQMVREVKQGHINFYSPEMNIKQAIQPFDRSTQTALAKQRRRQPGFGGATIFIKGVRATPAQIRILTRALDQAQKDKAPNLAQLALVCALIGENTVSTHTDSSNPTHKGPLQSTAFKETDVEGQVHAFLTGGKSFGAGGAIKLAKKNPQMSPGTIATKVEVSGQPGSFYDAYKGEAEHIVKTYTGDTSFSLTVIKREAFQRGVNGKREDSWDCGQRLASDVNWKLFMSNGWLYYADELFLIRAEPRMIFNEDSPGVEDIDYELDTSKKVVGEVLVSGRADQWDAPPGTVAVIEGQDQWVDNRYLVHDVSRPPYSNDVQITLRLPEKPKPEPAPDTTTKQIGGKTSGTSVKGVKGSELLVALGKEAERMGLTVSECDAPGAPKRWGPVHKVHKPNSLHYKHRAFDASGPEEAMHRFSKYVSDNVTGQITQLIHNPGFAILDGKSYNPGPGPYADVWDGHKSHVHCGV